MKGGQNLRDLQAKQKEMESWVQSKPCLICNKVIGGAYANHGHGWTCSASCMRQQDAVPRYPGHEAATFEKEHNL